MEFSFFIILITAMFWILFRTGGAIQRFFFRSREGKRRVPELSVLMEIVFAFLLIAAVVWYAPRANTFWTGLTRKILWLLESGDWLRKSRMSEVSFVAQYFRQFYPAAVAVFSSLLVLVLFSRKRGSFWYRYMRKFSHWKVVPVILFWLAALISSNYNRYDQETLIGPFLKNLALYFSLFYSAMGFLILVFGLKKRGLPYSLSVMMLYLLLALSGRYFLFTLVLFMGVGISDIWMSYFNRKFKAAAADE